MKPFPATPGRWLSDRSITAILASIVLLGALPAMGVIVYSSFEARSLAELDARNGMQNLTQSLVAVQRGITNQADGLLATLAHTREVQARDLAACSRLFTSLLHAHAEFSNIFMTDVSGRVVATGLPAFLGVDLSDRQYFVDAMASKAMGISEYIFGRATKKPILVFARALLDEHGEALGIVGLSYFLDGYATFLQQMEMPPHLRVIIVDREGTRMLSYPANDLYPSGQPAFTPMWRRILGMPAAEGSFIGPRLTGEEGLFNYARLRLSPDAPPYMTIVVSSARNEALRPADLLLTRGLALAVLAALLALGIARLAGKAAIGRSLARLADAAGKLAAGDLTARAHTATGSREIRHLGASFDAMADALETRQSELIEAATALDKMRNMLNNILESMPSAIIGLDADGRLTHINAKAQALLGLDKKAALGHSAAESVPFLTEYTALLETALRERRSLVVERMPLRQNGDTHLMRVLFYPLIANGTDGVVIRLDDVTERERLRELMIQTEKMMSVGGLAAGMAHEINNPLGSILQAAQVIDMQLDPLVPANVRAAEEAGCPLEAVRRYLESRRVLRFLAGIREAGNRAAKIVASMLEFSRPSTARHEPADVNALVERSVALAGSDYDLKKKYDFRHIVLVRDFTAGPATVVCAATEIEQVLLNLLKNAAHAMAGEVAAGKTPTITLRTRVLADAVQIEVADNGPGMDEATRARVFEPFFTTKPPGEGTGLGLSVSYFIIANNHGGAIRMESEPGGGTTCVITLPRGEG